MRRLNTVPLFLAVVACSAFLALCVRAQAGPRPIGAGAFPVSFTHASAWFAQSADANRKAVILLVYFEGAAGWHNQDTDFKWQVNESPATIQMSVGNIRIDVKYFSNTSDVEIQGTKQNLSNSNVFVVKAIDSTSPEVKALGIHDLSFGRDDIPAVALLRRDPDVWAALTGRSSSEHFRTRASNINREVLAWDEEGLRLLLTANPESERRACGLFRQAASKGYAPSQYRLGYCYQSGSGVDQNLSTANEWYERAAKQGHVDAQYKLGYSYQVGRGVPINLDSALQWYKKAAENGDSDALFDVGMIYATGQGAKADNGEAYGWFLKSALRGEPAAQFEIARRLKDGDGVTKDTIASYGWLFILGLQRERFAPADWEQIKTLTDSVESQLDRNTKAAAEKQAHDWLTTIAQHEMEKFALQE
jgi:TPR repeat protein